jgi:hypothetical protein
MAKLRRAATVAAVLAAAVAASGSAQAEPRPVVVELFTSQGCSSCPPADALLGELAMRGDVLALGFHISYWDGLGWKDPLSSPSATERQKIYARRLSGGRIYTPQIIIDGTSEMVGSDRLAVLTALRAARPAAVAPVSFAADRRLVMIGAGIGDGEVLLIRFARHRTTRVAAGENARRTLEDSNGVETLVPLGAWQGAALAFPVEPPAAGEGIAVLVQAADGQMLGAAAVKSDMSVNDAEQRE